MCPDTTETAPNSPIARALQRITPVSRAPLDVRQRHMPERLPDRLPRATSAASSSSLPCACISGISSRATNGKVTNIVASTMPGDRKDDLDVVVGKPRAEPTLHPEQQHIDQAGHHGRHRKGQVDQRDQQLFAAKLELGDRPRRRGAEDQIERDRDARHQQRELDRGQRIGLYQRRKVRGPALAQCLDEHGCQRYNEERGQEAERDDRAARSAPTVARSVGAGVASERMRRLAIIALDATASAAAD